MSYNYTIKNKNEKIIRMTQKEWAEMIEKAIRKNALKKKQKNNEEELLIFINKHKLITLTISIIASMIVIKFWGLKDFIEIILSWTIGLTTVSTLIASQIDPKEKKA